MSAPAFSALAREAASRYPARERYARHFAYGKLTRDPAFEHIVANGYIRPGDRVLDLGCGQGLLAALLAVAVAQGDWRYRGIDASARDIERARAASVPNSEFVARDIRDADFGNADVVVLLDVLHYIDPEGQADVLRRVREALAGGGTLLLRVADASRGIRFRATQAIDRAFTVMRGHRVSGLYSVPLAERVEALEREGFRVEAVPMSAGTPFVNVLLVARYDSKAP